MIIMILDYECLVLILLMNKGGGGVIIESFSLFVADIWDIVWGLVGTFFKYKKEGEYHIMRQGSIIKSVIFLYFGSVQIFYTTAVEYLAWSTEIKLSLRFEILIDITIVDILGSSNVTFFQVYPQTTFLFLHMHTKINSHQKNIIQLDCIHMIHTCSICTFLVVIVWSLLHLSSNWWDYEQIFLQNY